MSYALAPCSIKPFGLDLVAFQKASLVLKRSVMDGSTGQVHLDNV